MTAPQGGNTHDAVAGRRALAAGRPALESVAYRGEQAIVTDLMTGRVPFYAGSTHSLLPHLEGGKCRILAIPSPQRLAVLPEVPTFREAVHPDLVLGYWHGVPAPILTRLAAGFAEIRRKLPPDMAVDPVRLDEFAALIRQERAHDGGIIAERKITVQ